MVLLKREISIAKMTLLKILKEQVSNILTRPIEYFSRHVHLTVQLPNGVKSTKYKGAVETLQTDLNKTAQTATSKINKEQVLTSGYDEEVKVVEVKRVKLVYRQNTMTPTFVFHTYLKEGFLLKIKVIMGLLFSLEATYLRL